MDFKNKYLKYKKKYLELKKQLGGVIKDLYNIKIPSLKDLEKEIENNKNQIEIIKSEVLPAIQAEYDEWYKNQKRKIDKLQRLKKELEKTNNNLDESLLKLKKELSKNKIIDKMREKSRYIEDNIYDIESKLEYIREFAEKLIRISYSRPHIFPNITIDFGTMIKIVDPFTLEEFNGTIDEYINEDVDNVIFVVKENNKLNYHLTSRRIIQKVLNDPAQNMYPCIETNTLRRENIKKNIKLLNLRSIGLHTNLQYCIMNVYEIFSIHYPLFVIMDIGLSYPSFVSDDVLNHNGSTVGALHCQTGYNQKIGMLMLPQKYINSNLPRNLQPQYLFRRRSSPKRSSFFYKEKEVIEIIKQLDVKQMIYEYVNGKPVPYKRLKDILLSISRKEIVKFRKSSSILNEMEKLNGDRDPVLVPRDRKYTSNELSKISEYLKSLGVDIELTHRDLETKIESYEEEIEDEKSFLIKKLRHENDEIQRLTYNSTITQKQKAGVDIGFLIVAAAKGEITDGNKLYELLKFRNRPKKLRLGRDAWKTARRVINKLLGTNINFNEITGGRDPLKYVEYIKKNINTNLEDEPINTAV